MTRPTSTLLLALATAACTCEEAPAPIVTAVEPTEAPSDLDTVLVVRGANFLPAVAADLDDPGQSRVDAAFALELVGPAGDRVALVSATLVSESEIRATLPAGASPAAYDLHLADPRGRGAVLADALLVFLADCAEDGTPCDDGDACTMGDACQDRLCRAGSPVSCAAPDACHLAGACDPGTGLCSSPPAPDGTACQSVCVAGETCQAGACTLPPGGCTNTAPLARLTVTPRAAAPGAPVTFDGSGSTDAEEPTSALRVEFDFEGSGVFSPPQPATQPASHAFALPGTYEAWVRVTDSSGLGLAAYASTLVVVVDPAVRVEVTTAADENDPGATPDEPGNAGLSLREAVAFANGQAPPRTITFSGPLAVTIAQSTLALTAPYVVVVGEPGVTVDFGGHNRACFQLTAPGQRLVGLALRGCTKVFVQLLAGSHGAQVAHCDIGPGPSAPGIDAQNDSPTGSPPSSLIGPGNLIAGVDVGVRIGGTDYVVAGNRIGGNATGVVVDGVRSRLSGNAIFGQVDAVQGTETGDALRIYTGAGPVEVWHNVLDGNGRDGLRSDGVPLDVRNNLFTGNAGYGVRARDDSFAPGAFGWNGFSGNLLGAVGPLPLATGSNDVLADPLYADRPAADFRLLPGSPAIDGGVAIPGLDVNGPAPGEFDHLAPDLGLAESPY
jgi:hypothetical protein